MKKIGNIIMDRFMSIVKSRHSKHIAAAAVAILLAAAVVTSSVFSRTQAAENADTLMGIEKLRNQFSDGAEYTVLEIVPDINAAEIGYLFDGYEPILSEWDSETMTWKSWRDVLCGISTFDKRKEFIDTKKVALQDYYDKQGIKDNVPVVIPSEEYLDSEEYIEGYEEVEAGSYDATGYFTLNNGILDTYYGDYNVSFYYIGNIPQQTDTNTVYYKAVLRKAINTVSVAEKIPDGTYIYKMDGEIPTLAGPWAKYKEVVMPTLPESGRGETSSDDSGGNGGTDSSDENENREDGNVDDNTGGADNNETGGDDGDDSGSNDGTDNGDDVNNNGNTEDDNGNTEGGSDVSNSGSTEGGSDVNDSGDTESDNISDDGKTSVSTALKNSVAKIKWLKFVNDNNDNAGDSTPKTASEVDSGKGPNNGSNDAGNTNVATDGSENTPSSGTDNSGNGSVGTETTTDDGTETPDDGTETPGGGSETSGGDTETPGSGSETPGDGTETPGGNNPGGSSDDDKGDNQGNNGDDNSGDEGDGSEQNPDDENNDPDKDADKDPDKNSDKEPGKNPGKGDVTAQAVGKAESETYYLVYFERITDVTSYNEGHAYVVDEIKPAQFGSNQEGEANHPMGQYDFEKAEGENTQTYTFPGRVLYCKGIFHNNEWFKQYVINMDRDNSNDFKVKVITMTPDNLNKIYTEGTKEYEQGTIPDFDFLYLNSGSRTYEIDVTSSDENSGNPEGGDTQVPDEPSGNEEGGNPDEGDKPDEGDDNKPDDGENTGDTGEDKPDNGDGSETTNEDNKPDNGGDSGNTNEDSTSDNGDDNDNDDGNVNEDNNSNNGGGSVNTNNDNNSDNGGNSGSNTENSKPDKGTDSNASDNGGNNKSNSGENSAASVRTSAWRTYVSQDDSKEPSIPDASESTNDTDNTSNTGSTGSTNSTGNTSSTENTSNTNTSDDADDTDNTGNTGNTNTTVPADTENNGNNTGNTEGEGNTNTEGNTTDTDNEGNVDNNDIGGDDPDNSVGGNDDNTNTGDSTDSDKEEPSSDSDKTGDESESKAKSSIVLYNTGTSDISEDVANLLFKKVASEALPCLVDGLIIYGKDIDSGEIIDSDANTVNTKLFRLATLLCQENLEKDCTSYTKEQLLKGIVEDADKNFTTEQVYCRLGNGSINNSIINDNFFTHTIYKEGGEIEEGFQNVLDEILLENLYRESDSSGHFKPLPTDISQAEAVRHILNYQNRRSVETKKKVKVLEIQPAYTTKAEITKEQLQKWAPGVEEVETTIMTTAEFIGKIDKLNEIYDLVYIGTSKEHLNLKNWITDGTKSKDGKYLGSTVFNDSDMDGLIYYNVGDKRVVNLPLSGLLDSENKNGRTYFYNFVRYSGNDITKEKKDALLSFLKGSYPIIVSDEFIEQPVTVFENENFGGRSATLDVGEYKESDLEANQVYSGANTPAKGISSIQVKEGYQVTLFATNNLKGSKITISSNVNNLTSLNTGGLTWNNRCRSMIVEKIEDEKVQPVRKIDGNHIDNSSYVYELANTALEKKYTNFFVKGDIDENSSELLKFYLNRPKASLTDFTTNGVLGDSLDGRSSVNDVYYIYPNTIGRYTLQYNFTIKNEGAASMDTRYNCKLYIDVNADGKFSDFEEVTDIVMLNRQTGGVVATNELYAGVPYTVTREVPSGYKGLLPWKIEVCQVNNDNIYASEQGYTKLDGMDKETIKVCQIYKNQVYKNSDDEKKDVKRVIDLEDEIYTTGRYFNILVYGGDYGGVHYPGISNDFDIQVESMTVSEFENYYNKNNNDPDKGYNPDYLDSFNMLILGFSDAYDDFDGDANDPDTPLGAIIEFIDSGKSVLMGHDTTSYFNNPVTAEGTALGYTNRNGDPASLKGVSNTRFAANINKYIRPLVGMDRYGVLSSPTVKRGVSLKDGASGWGDLFSSGKEVAYKPKSARKETVPEAHGYTYGLINVRDTDENGAVKSEFSRSNVGVDFNNTYVNQRFDNVYYDNDNYDNGEINSANTSGKVLNSRVTQVNQGQITEYPYKLEEEFEVGQTHTQYYQLDYTADDDGDGQSDLVVWYCLGGRTASSEDKQQTIYSQSPNDVRNNYYIYNKGNITYTGMGHGANDKKTKGDNLAYTFEEAKLFINTIIAAYQAGVKPPTVTVLESGLPEASQLTTMYRYYDEANMISITDAANTEAYEKVYFTVRDLNFVKGSRVIATHAYYHIDALGGSETISVDGEEIPVIPLDDNNMFNASDDTHANANELISGNIYYILVPKTVMSQCENGLDIYFEAQSTITTNTTKQNVYTTDKVYAKLQVLRAYLFELD